MYTQPGHTPIKIARIYLRVSTEEQDLTCCAAVKSRTGASLLLIFFGELTTPLSCTLWSTFHHLQPQIVVHCDDNFLLRTQITFRRLDRGVPRRNLIGSRSPPFFRHSFAQVLRRSCAPKCSIPISFTEAVVRAVQDFIIAFIVHTPEV